MNHSNKEFTKFWSEIHHRNKVIAHKEYHSRSYSLKRPAPQDGTGNTRKRCRIDETDTNTSSNVANDLGAALDRKHKWHNDYILWKCWEIGKLHQKKITGEGVTIAIVDSGINITHRAFSNRIVAVNDVTRSGTIDLTTDRNGHGTMCASVACGALHKRNRTVPAGVAPMAKLVVYKISDSIGCSNPETIADALEQCLEDKETYKIDIVLLPNGSTYYSFRQDKAILRLLLANVLVVAASGDYGENENLYYPGRFGSTICVGAHDSHCNTTNGTTKGQALDFTAPGDGLVVASSLHPTAYTIASGTSLAASCVAGLLALIIQFTTNQECNSRILKKLNIPEDFQPSLNELVHTQAAMKKLLQNFSNHHQHTKEDGFGHINVLKLFDDRCKLLKTLYEDVYTK